jgi:hypothetical protein
MLQLRPLMAIKKASVGKRSNTQVPPRTEARRSLLQRAIRLLSWGIPFVISLTGFFAYFPIVTLHYSASVRKQEPSGAVFELVNESLLPIYTVAVICVPEERSQHYIFLNNKFMPPGSNTPKLSPHQPMDIPCEQGIVGDSDATEVQMKVDVSYRPSFAWWRRSKTFEMQAERADDGTWVWKMLAG